MKKRLTAIVLLSVMVLGLVGCGSKADYSKLERMLDKGQYDAAISYIEELKEEASKQPMKKKDVDAACEEYFEKIKGEYVGWALENDFTINDDWTITLEGKTYPFFIEVDDSYESGFRVGYEDGDSRCGFSFTIYDNGVVSARGAFNSKAIADQVNAFKNGAQGTFQNVDSDDYYGFGKTITIDGDKATYETGEGSVRYYYYQYEDGEGFFDVVIIKADGDAKSMDYKVLDSGEVVIGSDYYKTSCLEYVDITADNIWTYFEYCDLHTMGINKNAFDEIENVYAVEGLKLKDEYAAYYVPEVSEIALELSAPRYQIRGARASWNSSTNAFSVTGGEERNLEDATTKMIERLNYSYDEWERNEKVVYYLYNESTSIYNGQWDGDVYYMDDVWVTSTWRKLENITVTRSATKLAFVKH